MDEIVEFLEESDFDVTIECEEDEEEWTEILIFEESLVEPIRVTRMEDEETVEEELNTLYDLLSPEENNPDYKDLFHTLSNCISVYGAELPDDCEEEDNALLLSNLVAQCFAQKVDGVYTVDDEGIFDDSGELLFEQLVED